MRPVPGGGAAIIKVLGLNSNLGIGETYPWSPVACVAVSQLLALEMRRCCSGTRI